MLQNEDSISSQRLGPYNEILDKGFNIEHAISFLRHLYIIRLQHNFIPKVDKGSHAWFFYCTIEIEVKTMLTH